MKIALSCLLIGSAAAFAPVAQNQRPSTKAAATAELDSMLGVDIESGKKVFDPLGLAEYAPADFLRKAELSNGRSAMLATVGFVAPSLIGKFPSDDVTTDDPIEAILQADPQWWAQFLLLCGVIEGVKYRAELEGKSYTGEGEPAVDYLNLWPKLNDKQKEEMRLKELKNGRLAMIGMAGFFADHFIPGSVPGMPDF